MKSGTDDPIVACAARIRELGERLRHQVEEGQLEPVASTLAARAEALTELVRRIAEMPETRAEAYADTLVEVQEDGQHLIEWATQQKAEVGQALAAMRTHDADPYRERVEGPAVLDQHR